MLSKDLLLMVKRGCHLSNFCITYAGYLLVAHMQFGAAETNLPGKPDHSFTRTCCDCYS